MKTQSGPIKLAILAAVAVVAAITLRGFAQSAPAPTELPDPSPSNEKFVLKIKPRHPLKDSTDATEKAFKDLLNNGHYEAAKGNKVHLRHTAANKPDEYLPTGAGASSTKLEIQTDKVTKSETAQNIEVEELTVIQPHVTIQVASRSPDDIKAVLDLMAP